MFRRRLRAFAGAAIVVTFSMLIADGAHADPVISPGSTITINTYGGTTNLQAEDGKFLPMAEPAKVSPQCFDVEESTASVHERLCLGAQGTNEDLKVLTDDGPYIRAGLDAHKALRWIVDEAVTHLRIHYGLPLDSRIEDFGFAEIRAYMVQRVLGILDKSVHGIALSEPERRAVSYLQQRIQQADQRIAGFAYDEYQKWRKQKCGYHPPAAPAFVEKRVLLPDDVFRKCNLLQAHTTVAFDFSPPIPSVSDFMAWGFYRHAESAGVAAFGTPGAQDLMQDMLAAGLVLGSFGVASAAGAGAAAMVGGSAALSAAVVTAMGSTATGVAAAASYPASALSAMIGSTAASAAGWVVAIVVVGVVVTVVSTIQVVEDETIGVELRTRKENTAKVKDPFNLAAQRIDYGGTPIGTGWDVRLPSHRSAAVTSRLRQLLFELTTIGPDGNFYPDEKGLWPNNGTDISTDVHFEVKIGEGAFEPVASIELPQPAGEPSPLVLRFDRSWPILTNPAAESWGALTFSYLNAEGKLVYASRLSDNQFVLGEVESMRTGEGKITPQISFLDGDGRLVTARLVDPSADAAGAGVRPAAVGMMLPNRPVRLRPNPVTDTGAFYPPERVDDLEFDWTVYRFDRGANAWVSLVTLGGSSPSFTPDDVGSYYAEVVRTGDGDMFRGRVDFEIMPPEITIDSLQLEDNGYSTLRLVGVFSERVGSDDLTVTVRWPGMLETPEAGLPSFDLVCVSHNGDCATTPNPAGIQIAQRTLDLNAVDLNESVVVTVTNSWGVSVQRSLPLDSSVRPQLSAPPSAPVVDGNARVQFNDGVIFLQVPAAVAGFQSATLATITLPAGDGPGAYFLNSGVLMQLTPTETLGLTAEPDGTVQLKYTGMPAANALSLDDYAFTVVSGSATTILLRREVVPAVDGKFRAAAAYPAGWSEADGTIPLLNPVVLGGLVEWSDYEGDICIELTHSTGSPPTVHELCAPMSSFFDLNAGELTELSFDSLLPAGFASGLWRVKAWLPSPEDPVMAQRVSVVPTQTNFTVVTDAPSVALAWDGSTQTMTRSTTVQQGAPALVGSVCTLDGSAIACFETGDAWALTGLSDGLHELRVVVTDSSGNHSTAASSFRIGEATVPGNETTDPGTSSPGVSASGSSSPRAAPLFAEHGAAVHSDAAEATIEEPALPEISTPEDSAEGPDQSTDAEETDGLDASDSPRTDAGMPWFALPFGLVLLVLLIAGGFLLFRRRAAE